LDAGPLGTVTNPRATLANEAARNWLQDLLATSTGAVIPEISDYEVRRELLRVRSVRGLARLDSLAGTLEYEPLTTAAMRRAARFWAAARQQGMPTAANAALECDVILAAQAAVLADAGNDVLIATTNVAHLSRFWPAKHWSEIR
jgi:predicted nucleic acid-binding protein